jgi:hypothetical protein
VRRYLQHVDQCLAGDLPLKATVLIGCNDDDLLSAVDGDKLRPVGLDATDEFGEPRLGIL